MNIVTGISQFNKLACWEVWIISFGHALKRVAQQLPKLQQTLHGSLQSLEKGFLSIFSEIHFCSLLFSPSARAAGAPQPVDTSHLCHLLYPTLRESPEHDIHYIIPTANTQNGCHPAQKVLSMERIQKLWVL